MVVDEDIKGPLLDHQHILYNKTHVLGSGGLKGHVDSGMMLTFIHHLLTLHDSSVNWDYMNRHFNNQVWPRISQLTFFRHHSVHMPSVL